MTLELLRTLSVDRVIASRRDRGCEERVKPKLQEFINQNYRAIRAGRALAQAWDGQIKLDQEQIKELQDFIESSSEGQLKWWDGFLLCEIGDNGEEFQHHGRYWGNELLDGERAVKGFWFHFYLGNTHFECVDLDFGRSREYWDSMDERAKTTFIRRFAYRHLSEGDLNPHNPDQVIDHWSRPNSFTAFISDNGESFKIEKMIATKPLKGIFL